VAGGGIRPARGEDGRHRGGVRRQGPGSPGAGGHARPRRRAGPARRGRRRRGGPLPPPAIEDEGADARKRTPTARGPFVISFLEGELVEKAADRIVLAIGGTGYEVLVPVSP